MGKHYKYSGMDNKTYDCIEENSVFNMSSMGNVTIKGRIGKGTIVNASGMGNLKIKGKVEEGVIFNISSMGNVIFKIRPPESVVKSINKSGLGNVKMPGGYESNTEEYPSSSYNMIMSGIGNTFNSNNVTASGANSMVFGGYGGGVSVYNNNGIVTISKNDVITNYRGSNVSVMGDRIIIDNVEVREGDRRFILSASSQNGIVTVKKDGVVSQYRGERISVRNTKVSIDGIPVSEDDSRLISSSATDNKKKTEPTVAYSKSLNDYISTFKNKKKISERINELNLSKEEKKLFKKYQDSITREYMDIPVTLNEKYFDITTIAKLKSIDPFSNVAFEPLEIQSARTLVNELDKDINALLNKRNETTEDDDELGSSLSQFKIN